MSEAIDREIHSAARVRALEALLTGKGLITGETVDKVLEFFEKDMGPFNGARIVAKAWVDSDYKKRLLEDTPSAISELKFPLGMTGAEGEHMKAVENTPHVHNLIVCTMCSCYPWPVLGLPPYWFKDPTFRARAIREPQKSVEGVWLENPRDDGGPGVGHKRPDSLVRSSGGSGWDRRLDRAATRRDRDARSHAGRCKGDR